MNGIHRMRRFWPQIGASLSLAALTVAMTGPTLAQETVKVGALMAMTGDLQAFGETSLNGIQLAVDQINAAGGVLDGELEIVVGDTQTAAQPSIDAAQKLVSVDGAIGILGALSSGNTIPVAQSVTSTNSVPQISNASTSPVITGLEDEDFLFRTAPSDAYQGVALSQVTREQGFESLAIIYVNNDYGEGLSQSFTSAFEAAGGTITGSVPYEQGNASYRGELSQLTEEEPEALVLIGYPENGVTILRQALEEGFFDRFVFTDGMKAPEIIEQIGGEFLEGSVGTVPQALTDTDAYSNFEAAYEEVHGEVPPKPYIDTAYDAAMVMALAIEQAGSTDSVAIRDALREVANAPGTEVYPGEWAKAKELIANGEDIDYVGASGSINFDENGDVSGTFAEWVIEGGEIKTVQVFDPAAE